MFLDLSYQREKMYCLNTEKCKIRDLRTLEQFLSWFSDSDISPKILFLSAYYNLNFYPDDRRIFSTSEVLITFFYWFNFKTAQDLENSCG